MSTAQCIPLLFAIAAALLSVGKANLMQAVHRHAIPVLTVHYPHPLVDILFTEL